MEYLPTQSQSLHDVVGLQRVYGCRCEKPVFFRNSHCLSCDTPLGYAPELGRVVSLDKSISPDGGWRVEDGRQAFLYRRCANFHSPAGCNWLVRADLPGEACQAFCISCRLNQVIPDLSLAGNRILWHRVEVAKRQVVAALVGLGLPVRSRVTEDPSRGLAFKFLRSPAPGTRILTGHDNGTITLNIEEADDVQRELTRAQLREPYRTLVGHFRHEMGHYYWYRLVAGSEWQQGFRSLFGDETQNYEAALRTHYERGPRADWPCYYVSAYASVHPWEDWAETWAHYMHMIDTLGTSLSLGLRPENVSLRVEPFSADALYQPEHPDSQRFLSLLNSWVKLTAVLNELARSMGQPDLYPFALPCAAVAKLQFVHRLIGAGRSPVSDRDIQ